MVVLWEHQESDDLGEHRHGLLGLSDRLDVFHAVLSVPVPLPDEAGRIRRPRKVGVVRHYDHAVERDMNVYDADYSRYSQPHSLP